MQATSYRTDLAEGRIIIRYVLGETTEHGHN